MTLEEILRYRAAENVKCYLIELNDSSLVVILGSKMKILRDDYSDLWREVERFISKEKDWLSVFKTIKRAYDTDKWLFVFDNRSLNLDVKNIYERR